MNKKVLILLIIVVFIHLLFNSKLQLHYDEAYYWVWSKNLQLSYFDHPPMIAYLIKLTTIFSDKVFFIRLTAVSCSLITILMIYKLTKRVFGQQAADIAIILALAWPILEGCFFIVTIDCPLLMFWSITCYCLYRGLIEHSKLFIYLSGAALGCALLSKYTAILILPGILLYILSSQKSRKLLFSLDIYLSLCLAILIFSPVVIWNYQHDWISFKFQLHHGIPKDKHLNFQSLFDYIGGALGGANPFIALAIIFFMIKKYNLLIKNERYRFLLSIFVFNGLFFAYNSLFKFMEANWIAPAFITAIVFLAGCLAQYNIKWLHRTAICLILVLLLVLKLPEILIPKMYRSKLPAINAFLGNQQLYQQITIKYLQPNDIILACDYGNASRGWYYLNSGRIYVLSNFPFANSYKYWNNLLNYPIKKALYYCDLNDKQNLTILKQYFKYVEQLPTVNYADDFVKNKLYIFRAAN